MPLSPEEIKDAERRHRFVRAYERERERHALKNWSGYSYLLAGALLVLVILIVANTARGSAHHSSHGYAFTFPCMTFVATAWRRQRYRADKIYLADLERLYGPDLAWIKEDEAEAEVEKHLAAVKQIQQELAKHPAAS